MRVGILSDIHEDVSSLSLAFRKLEQERCDQVISLGDILGVDNGYYGNARIRDAEACVRLVRANCSVSVAGNHDLFAVRRLPGYTAGFAYPVDWYDRDLAERQRISKGILWDYSVAEEQVRLSDESREYLAGLPESAKVGFGGLRIALSHHLYPDLSGSLRKMPSWSPDLWPHLKWMKKQGCSFCISGHIHIRGALVGNRFHLHTSSKNSFPSGNNWSWISAPPVTVGGVPNGFMILDTGSGLITLNHLDSSYPS